jgi:lipid kinase YegS
VRIFRAALRDAGVQLDVRVTWEAGDAERYVAEAIADGIDAIVAGGGDGTLSEVATTLAHRDESAEALPALGLLPLGTANDFARAAGIPDTPHAALRLLLQQPATPIDLLKLDANGTTHWAANLASGGFGTQVTTETHEGLKKWLGGLAYVVTGLSKLGRIEPLQARLHGPGFARRARGAVRPRYAAVGVSQARRRPHTYLFESVEGGEPGAAIRSSACRRAACTNSAATR